jgi:hypothetical protein
VPTSLTPGSSGVIHFYKNIYEPKIKIKNKYRLYAIIEVKQPPGKSNSLEFTIADGYNTPTSVPNVTVYNTDIQKEMDVIITVLNRLFDEKNKEFYIGNPNLQLVNKFNAVANNINTHSTLISRKNKTVKILPTSYIDNSKLNIIRNKNGKRTTRRKIIS